MIHFLRKWVGLLALLIGRSSVTGSESPIPTLLTFTPRRVLREAYDAMTKAPRGQAIPEYALVLAILGVVMMIGFMLLAATSTPTLNTQQQLLSNSAKQGYDDVPEPVATLPPTDPESPKP